MRQKQALTVLMAGENVFLTGAPGAGKTYLLNEFIRRAKKAKKRVAVTASTGIAATHIGGTTIHSWAGIGIRDQLSAFDKQVLAKSNKFVKRYNSTDILVIDEVSMLHGVRLDMVNQIAKLLRQDARPFGGMQVILVGDLFQLPPVNRMSELVDFAHTSAAWEELEPKICYITEQHRQSTNDGLLDLLQAMRSGYVEPEQEQLLAKRVGQRPAEGNNVTRLYAHNIDVDALNQRQLEFLPGESRVYNISTKGRKNKIEQLAKGLLAPQKLELKIGAEVMFVANDFSAGYVNGTRGRVVDFSDEELPLVELYGSNNLIEVEPHNWSLEEDGRKVAEATQLPLRLAWAITIHKSQGMSLDAAEIDLAKTFTPGMGYVALSRVRSLDGIYLRGINNMALQLHEEIFEFDNTLRHASADLALQVTDYIEEKPAKEIEQNEEDFDEQLFSDLKNWRLKRAATDSMPAYIIAHDTCLKSIATHRPQTNQQLLGIHGFGPAKLEKYGPEILEITNNAANQGVKI